MGDNTELLERLAALEHEQWSGWMRYMFSQPLKALNRWERQMETDYADLSEDEKESDRAEARKVLAIVSVSTVPKCVKCNHSVGSLDQEGMCHTAVWPKGNPLRSAGYPCGCHCEFVARRTSTQAAETAQDS